MVGGRPQIAADIANDLIQRLYETGLTLYRLRSLVDDGNARAEVRSALASLNEIIRIVQLGVADFGSPNTEEYIGRRIERDAVLATLLDKVGACARGELPLPDREQLADWLVLLKIFHY